MYSSLARFSVLRTFSSPSMLIPSASSSTPTGVAPFDLNEFRAPIKLGFSQMTLSPSLQNTLQALSAIAVASGIENGLLKVLLKIVGVGYLTEFSAGVLNDFGAGSVADKVVLGGKLTVLLLSIPIIESLLSLFKQFLTLL